MRRESAMAEMQTPVISVIIPSYNTRELLSRCLASIYSAPPDRPFEVSSWTTRHRTQPRHGAGAIPSSPADRQPGKPRLRILEQPRNGDVTRRFVYLLNSDTEVSPLALDHLASSGDTP